MSSRGIRYKIFINNYQWDLPFAYFPMLGIITYRETIFYVFGLLITSIGLFSGKLKLAILGAALLIYPGRRIYGVPIEIYIYHFLKFLFVYGKVGKVDIAERKAAKKKDKKKRPKKRKRAPIAPRVSVSRRGKESGERRKLRVRLPRLGGVKRPRRAAAKERPVAHEERRVVPSIRGGIELEVDVYEVEIGDGIALVSRKTDESPGTTGPVVDAETNRTVGRWYVERPGLLIAEIPRPERPGEQRTYVLYHGDSVKDVFAIEGVA